MSVMGYHSVGNVHLVFHRGVREFSPPPARSPRMPVGVCGFFFSPLLLLLLSFGASLESAVFLGKK